MQNIMHDPWTMFIRSVIISGILQVLSAVIHSRLFDPSADRELVRLKEKNKILHDTLLSEKCQQPADAAQKRELLATTEEGILFELEDKLQKKLISALIRCRKERQPTTASPLPSTTTPQAAQSALVHCEEAINLIEPWRTDTNGT